MSIPQNVGGYKLDTDTNSLPIFIKYEASQYGDRFLNPGEIEWFSKNNRSLQSPEFKWLLDGTEHTSEWKNRHFVPIFIRRKAEEKEKSYYYVGSAVAVDDAHESVNIADDGTQSKVVISTLKLAKPVDPSPATQHSSSRKLLTWRKVIVEPTAATPQTWKMSPHLQKVTQCIVDDRSSLFKPPFHTCNPPYNHIQMFV